MDILTKVGRQGGDSMSIVTYFFRSKILPKSCAVYVMLYHAGTPISPNFVRNGTGVLN